MAGKRKKRLPKTVPASAPERGKSVEEILKELEAQDHLRLGTEKVRPFKPIKVKGKPLSQIIIEDRE